MNKTKTNKQKRRVGSKEKAEPQKGLRTMTIEEAQSLTFEEFSILDEACKGFNGQMYKNHQIRTSEETFGDYLKEGSSKLKENPMIKGKLL